MPGRFRILAVDPGFSRAGVAVFERAGRIEKLLHSGCVETGRATSFPARLARIGKEIEELIERYAPNALALEKIFFTKNQKTAMAVAEARGMILFLAARRDIPVFEYTPSEVKVAVTGYGRAGKADVERMVRRLVPVRAARVLDDEIDAIAVALACAAREGRRLST